MYGGGNVNVYALSDLHVDYADNRAWLDALLREDYRNDALIVAGDVSDDLVLLERTLSDLKAAFAHVCFVPGNHDLWLRDGEARDSFEKFRRVLRCCARVGVHTGPARLTGAQEVAWVVPLFGWYALPEEGEDTLYVPGSGRELFRSVWADRRRVRWPAGGPRPVERFLDLNEAHLRDYDAPVISFSHFLPRRGLLRPTPAELERYAALPERHKRRVRFNFSRVAGTRGLERQLRRLGARVHVYGHQHRNRERTIDGVRYVSHCLGYPHERAGGRLLDPRGPALVWGIE